MNKKCLLNTNAPLPQHNRIGLISDIDLRPTYLSRTIYIPSLKLLGKSGLELSVVQGVGYQLICAEQNVPPSWKGRGDKKHAQNVKVTTINCTLKMSLYCSSDLTQWCIHSCTYWSRHEWPWRWKWRWIGRFNLTVNNISAIIFCT